MLAASRPESSQIEIRELVKTFTRGDGTRVTAVDGISVDVQPGELLALLGPSGCGKTTLLRCIAGLERPDRGSIRLAGRPVYDSEASVDLAPEERLLGMMFQSYALWPHMTVREIVSYPLRVKRQPKSEVRERVSELLDLMNVLHLADEYPGRLSGGQQQRVALARSLAVNPEIVLFDEPLSNVDAKVRKRLRSELVEMKARLGFSGVYVTHDQEEAMHVGDRIAVLREGHIEQLDTPQELYDNPAALYVADFLGDINIFEGHVERVDGRRVRVSTPLGVVDGHSLDTLSTGSAVSVVFRPEDVTYTPIQGAIDPDVVNTWSVSLIMETFLGNAYELLAEVVGSEERLRIAADRSSDAPRIGPATACVAADDVRVFERE